MNFNKDSQNTDKIEKNKTLSIDEFFRHLEAKEQDLDISSELVIEIEESDIDDNDAPEFLKTELPKTPEPIIPAKNTSNGTDGKIPNPDKEITQLHNRIAKIETERTELVELSRRRQMDFENFKNRTERERQDTYAKQLSNLATQILPVLDNLNRALDNAPSISVEGQKLEFQMFFDGIVLVNQQLNEVLAGMGIEPIKAVGETFDPHFHEAVATEQTTEVPPNTVTAELLRGYKINERVIRPSMVKVAAAKS